MQFAFDHPLGVSDNCHQKNHCWSSPELKTRQYRGATGGGGGWEYSGILRTPVPCVDLHEKFQFWRGGGGGWGGWDSW